MIDNSNADLLRMLTSLRLHNLKENWEDVLKKADKGKPSYVKLLTTIIEQEYYGKTEKARLTRIKKANIPDVLPMETYPFSRQPRLRRQNIMGLYDSLRYMQQPNEVVFIGPTGCGKTGLATAFLLQALNKGYKGYFIEFSDLTRRLYQSRGDHSEYKILKKLKAFDILLIDEMGYTPVEEETSGLFFDLIKGRNRHKTTLYTSQLGFSEWNLFLPNKHMASGLLDRITSNGTVFNMKDCVSLRAKF